MKEQSVLAIIVLLLCSCISFGNGSEETQRARNTLRIRYAMFPVNLNDPNYLPHRRTILQYLREVTGKEKKWENLLRKIDEYSFEKLSGPPGSDPNSMTEDERKLATEYHLWLSGWYYVRFITLSKAGERDINVADNYPSIYKCRDAASTAYVKWKYHEEIYLQYLKTLGKNAREDIIQEHKFPSNIYSQAQFQIIPDNVDIVNVLIDLEYLIKGLLRRKKSMNSSGVKDSKSIAFYLTPQGKRLNKNLMSKLRRCFSVEDFSKLPEYPFINDRAFLEVGWLFNQYRNLWHEIRCNYFQKFLNNLTMGARSFTLEQVQNAIKDENANSIHYRLLFDSYGKIFKEFHAGRPVNYHNTASASAVGLEQKKVKRKRTKFERGKKEASTTSFHEYLENEQSESLVLYSQDPSEMVTMEVNGQSEAKRSKCLEADIQNDIYHAGQSKYSNAHHETQIETDALEVEEQEELLDANTLQEFELLKIDSWLKHSLEQVDAHQTPDGLAENAMTILEHSQTLEPDNPHETCVSKIGVSKITEVELAGEWQSRVEWNTNTAVHGHENLAKSEKLQSSAPESLAEPSEIRSLWECDLYGYL